MFSQNFDSETTILFRAIRRYKRAGTKFAQGKPSVALADRKLDDAYEDLLDALERPHVIQRLEKILAVGRQAANDGTLPDLKDPANRDDIEAELDLATLFGLKRNEVATAVSPDGKEDPLMPLEISSAREIIEQFENFHETWLEKVSKTRGIPIRIEKKKRKRNLGQAAVSILYGTACGVANTYALPGMPLAAASYAVSMNALHQAIRDIVGEKPKD